MTNWNCHIKVSLLIRRRLNLKKTAAQSLLCLWMEFFKTLKKNNPEVVVHVYKFNKLYFSALLYREHEI